jgi:hypothetical protein
MALSMGGKRLDTRNPTSKLVLTILADVATWESETMLERQREGIAKPEAEGKYKGRKPTVAVQAERIRAMRAAGEKPAHIAGASGWRGPACIGCWKRRSAPRLGCRRRKRWGSRLTDGLAERHRSCPEQRDVYTYRRSIDRVGIVATGSGTGEVTDPDRVDDADGTGRSDIL